MLSGMGDTLAQSIAQFEGFNISGSVAQRNNNPGNLRASPYATGKDSRGYAIFPDSQTGWSALDYQLGLYSQRGLTLQEMVNIYAPASDNNSPSSYLSFLESKLGVGPSAPVSSLYGNAVAPADGGDGADPSEGDSGGGLSTGAIVAIAAAAAVALWAWS